MAFFSLWRRDDAGVRAPITERCAFLLPERAAFHARATAPA